MGDTPIIEGLKAVILALGIAADALAVMRAEMKLAQVIGAESRI